MSNEKVIRQLAIEFLLNKYPEQNYSVREEYTTRCMKTRSDVTMFGVNNIIMVEIKSDMDTLSRLVPQISDYIKYSHKVYVFVDEKHRDNLTNKEEIKNIIASDYVECYIYNNSEFELFTLGQLREHNDTLTDNMLKLLWGDELKKFINFIDGRSKVPQNGRTLMKVIKQLYTEDELRKHLFNVLQTRYASGTKWADMGELNEVEDKEDKQKLFNEAFLFV